MFSELRLQPNRIDQTKETDMEDKRYPLPPLYAYLTFALSVAAGVATFFWLNLPWYFTVQFAFGIFLGTNLFTSVIGANIWRMPGSEKLQGWRFLVSTIVWILAAFVGGLVLAVWWLRD
jgi:hypothetical protein